MIYATAVQVRAALAGHPDLPLPAPPDPDSTDALEPLIARAEHAVDLRLGPYTVDPTTGRKLDPTLLNAAQRDALERATAAALGHLAQLAAEQDFGVDDYTPALLTPQRGTGIGAVIDRELSGAGLIARSGCAQPDPVPVGPGILLGGPDWSTDWSTYW